MRIDVSVDKDARTLTIRDNGIGMSRDEVIANIGTIASSGTRKFLEALSAEQKADANLIGQFGVGFYSAFVVADKVTLTTRQAGAGENEGVRWESAGTGEYTLETVDGVARGTSVTLHLKADEDEFLQAWSVRSLIARYSDHIGFPIRMPKESANDEKDGKPTEADPIRPIPMGIGKSSIRPRRCGRGRSPSSRTRNTRISTSTSRTISTTRWRGRTTASKATRISPRCCTCRRSRRST